MPIRSIVAVSPIKIDVVVLGALEIDVDFNVNVITGSEGNVRGASGGHSDTASGANLTVVVCPSFRGRIPIIKKTCSYYCNSRGVDPCVGY